MRACMSLLLLAVACRTGGDAASGHTATDSAGVRITTSTAPVWGDSAGWRISSAPVLEIGASEGGAPEYLLSGAHNAMQLSDGRIAVGDMGSAELRYYDAKGRFLKRTGRKGQGPGEWSQLYSMRRGGGDSIHVIAPINTHSVMSPSGDFVRRFSLEPVRNRPNIWGIGRLASGDVLAFSLAPPGDRLAVPREVARGEEEAALGRDTTTRPDEFYREEYMHFLYTSEGKVIDSIGLLPGRGRFGGSGNAAFLPRGHYAIRGDSLLFGPGDRPEVRVYEVARAGSSSGASARATMILRRIMRRVPSDSGVVTPAMMEAHRSRQRAFLTRAFRDSPGFSVERALREIRFPPRIPAHSRIIADPTGAIWMEDYLVDSGEEAPTPWTVFDADGRWLGRIELPAGLVVSDIGADYVLGIWRNDEDVQFIRKYRLDRGNAGER